MTDEQLAAIEQRVQAASPGPWTANVYSLEVNGPEMTIYDEGGHEQGDQQFIAHAREDVPALLAEVRLMREANGIMRAALIAWEKWAQRSEGILAAAAIHGHETPEWPRKQAMVALEAQGVGDAR